MSIYLESLTGMVYNHNMTHIYIYDRKEYTFERAKKGFTSICTVSMLEKLGKCTIYF